MKENANSRRNMQVVGDMYARVMRALAEKEGKGESYPSLKEAPVERLPYLVEKFIQAARKSNMEVYASGTFHFIWNRVANILSSRETDPVTRFGGSVFYAVGVLIISPTVGGCGLGGLRSNVDSEGGKYTSAIASVYLPPSSSTLR